MTRFKVRAAFALTMAVGLALTACGGDDNAASTTNSAGTTAAAAGTTSAAAGTTTAEITFWDPYPQREEGSEWDTLVKSCAPQGSTITRSSAPQTDLFNQLTTAVKEGNAPDVVLLDNPLTPEAASSGLLAPADEVGIDTSGVDENLLGPGVIDGVTYGVPMGSNALGLYYNEELLETAGVDVSTIQDWESLNKAIEQVVDSGAKGITFSGIAGEEGVFQFEPWFWGAGASFSDIASSEAISAGQLLSSWIGDGWAPRSALTDNQSASWDLFLTGEYGFAENGSWFASAAADNEDFAIGMIPIPGKSAPVAPVPTGGEFAVAPLQSDNASDHYANAAAVIDCLVGGDNAATSAETLGYLSANPEIRAAQVASNSLWQPWVSIITGAQGRTTDLGADYPAVSGQLSEALQGALDAAGDSGGVETAFKDAAGS
ncbi:MAG: sugar ABC transporter substrate-binding protein [Aeromicrobium sp.]